jgi:hypothetical protein
LDKVSGYTHSEGLIEVEQALPLPLRGLCKTRTVDYHVPRVAAITCLVVGTRSFFEAFGQHLEPCLTLVVLSGNPIDLIGLPAVALWSCQAAFISQGENKTAKDLLVHLVLALNNLLIERCVFEGVCDHIKR